MAAVVTAAGLGITFYSTGFETGGIQSRSADFERSLVAVVMRMPVYGGCFTYILAHFALCAGWAACSSSCCTCR